MSPLGVLMLHNVLIPLPIPYTPLPIPYTPLPIPIFILHNVLIPLPIPYTPLPIPIFILHTVLIVILAVSTTLTVSVQVTTNFMKTSCPVFFLLDQSISSLHSTQTIYPPNIIWRTYLNQNICIADGSQKSSCLKPQILNQYLGEAMI